jgi:integrase
MKKESYYKKYTENLPNTIGNYNAQLIQTFLEKYEAMPSEPGVKRLQLLAMRLKRVCEFVNNKKLDKLTENDLITLNLSMKNKNLLSSQDYRKTLKVFLRLTNKKKYFDLIDSEYLKAPRKKSNAKKLVNPETFWSEKEIETYLAESEKYTPRQSAWAGIWLSSGCRPGEILAMKKQNIEFTGTKLIMRVPEETKTGARTIVLEGLNAKGTWDYIEPYWKTLETNQKLFDIDWSTQYKHHKKVIKKCDLGENKDTTFYMARKLNLTKFYNTYGISKASSMAGHTPGSKSMKHYVAMSEADLLNEKAIQINKKVCPNPNCGKESKAHNTNCEHCGSPLNREQFAGLFTNQILDIIKAQTDMTIQNLNTKEVV